MIILASWGMYLTVMFNDGRRTTNTFSSPSRENCIEVAMREWRRFYDLGQDRIARLDTLCKSGSEFKHVICNKDMACNI